MRVDNNGRPKLRADRTSRLGDKVPVHVAKNHIDPIEYAQNALRQEYALRLAQYARQRGIP